MIKNILSHRMVAISSLISLVLVISSAAWSILSLRANDAGPFILHFDDVNGITQTGSLGTLAAVGIFGVILVAINTAIALALDKRDRFLGRFVALITLVLSVLLFIGFAAILGVN